MDLGFPQPICGVKLYWETALGRDFQIQVSDDAENWITIVDVEDNTEKINEFTDLDGSGRYVRMYGTERGTPYGYSLWEFEIYTRDEMTSTEYTPQKSKFGIYPNPGNGQVNLQFFSLEYTRGLIEVYDAFGHVVLIKELKLIAGENSIELDLFDLPIGIYFIKLNDRIKRYVKSQ